MAPASVLTDPAISRDDIKALKVADSATLFHRASGEHCVRLYLNSSGDRVYSATEQRMFPHVTDYGPRSRDIAVTSSVYCYADRAAVDWHGYYSWYSDAHRWAVASVLRAGDLLHLSWVADNNNELVKDAGLHVDQVHVKVIREGLTRPLIFLLGSAVGLDNSARMIRRAGA